MLRRRSILKRFNLVPQHLRLTISAPMTPGGGAPHILEITTVVLAYNIRAGLLEGNCSCFFVLFPYLVCLGGLAVPELLSIKTNKKHKHIFSVFI